MGHAKIQPDKVRACTLFKKNIITKPLNEVKLVVKIFGFESVHDQWNI